MTAAATILIVDDEPHIRRLLRGTLERAGYRVAEVGAARQVLPEVELAQPDIVLLDLGLPDRDGLELLPILSSRKNLTVLVVSARDATEEKVAALDLGAVDYVTKPFDTDELLARIRATLRGRFAAEGARSHVTAGGISIDLVERSVRRGGEEVHLTPKEFALVAELARHPGRVITHDKLLAALWPADHDRYIEYLRVIVRNLRHKLEADPARPALIVNELGVGYRLLADG